MQQALEGQELGRYRLCHLLGRGGMASVYLARASGKEGFERWVAIKVIHPHASDDPRFVRMFLNEARLSSRLYHPNICTVFDYGQVEGTHFLVMEYLHSESLHRVMKERIPIEFAVRIVADAARGLHAAHELRDEKGDPIGLVHRDVSPHNILVLYDGVSKVVDFGIARARDHVVETTTGSVKGKLAYMSPEQLHSSTIDRRTDVFALGIVAWEATLGWRLFKRSTAPATMVATLTEEIPLPTTVHPGYPEELERAVMRALERDPARRFQTMEAFADALEGALYANSMIATNAQVASWMKTTFPRQLAERNELLRDVPAPRPAIDLRNGSHETVTQTGRESEGTTRSSSVETSRAFAVRKLSRKRRLRMAVVFGTLSVVLTAVLAIGWLAWHDDRTPPTTGLGEHADAGVSLSAKQSTTDAATVDVVTDGRPTSVDVGTDSRPISGDAGTTDGDTRLDDAGQMRTAKRLRPGFVNVMSIPVAEVWLGSRRLGTTPLLRHPATPGRYVVRLKALGSGRDASGQERRVPIVVSPGKVSYISVRFDAP